MENIQSRNDYYGACPSHKHGICWASIIAGAVGTIAVSLIMFVLASSYGLAISSPWSGEGFSAKAVGINAVIAIIIIQWFSSIFGGYLAGRLRSRSMVHADEVCFRDMAHGFLTWAVATLVTVTLLGSAMTAIAGGGVKAAVTGTALSAASEPSVNKSNSMDYFVDTMFRSNKPVSTDASNAEVRAEVTRIMAKGLSEEDMSDADKDYLTAVVAQRAGISNAEAEARIDNTVVEIKKATDTARKTTATLAFCTFLSLVIGAFIASIAGVLGGRCRDEVQTI